MKNILKLTAMSILTLSVMSSPAVKATETNYEEKLPYKFKEPNWEKFKEGDDGVWPLPEVAPYSTGLYSLATNNAIDYKEDNNKFYQTASKYKSSGNLEVYFNSNPSTSITMLLPNGATYGKSIGGDTSVKFTFGDTKTKAYNNATFNDELILDNSQGQWLVTNGLFSRNNLLTGIRRLDRDGNLSIAVDTLQSNPWSVTGSQEYITPEDFLMGLSKSIYGIEQSRPIYIQSTPYRTARKVTWLVKNTKRKNSCGPITWEYIIDEWKSQDVSRIVPNWSDTSEPECGTSKRIDRGEYVVHPEGYLNNTFFRYYKDQNSFVSANVYELYFSRLLQKGIIDVNTLFVNADETGEFKPLVGAEDTQFSLTKLYANRFLKEYQSFGKDIEGNGRYRYPVWATELGALYSNDELKSINFGSNITDKPITLTSAGGTNMYEKALGTAYVISGSAEEGVISIVHQGYTGRIMSKSSVPVINALRLIEKAMRVEDGDMTDTEAKIISKKYEVQYLDNLSDDDNQTVSYLLAKGILNFENYQEYSNLFSPLTNSFAYKLLYRVANEDARLNFSELTLTDNNEIPANFNEYNQQLLRASVEDLSSIGSISANGDLVKGEDNTKLNLFSDITFYQKAIKVNGNSSTNVGTRYSVTASVDDPLKYLYRGMPLVNVNLDGSIAKINNVIQIYKSEDKKLYNDVDNAKGRYVGINKITFSDETDRYDIEFYAYGDDFNIAENFVKANLSTRIESVVQEVDSSSTHVITEDSEILSKVKSTDIDYSVKTNNDIVVNEEFGNTAYSGDNTTIAGNTVVNSETVVKVGSQNLVSLNAVTHLSASSGFDEIGQTPLLSVYSKQLKGLSIPVLDINDKVIGRTIIHNNSLSSKASTGKNKEFTKDNIYFNLSMMNSSDTLISDRMFEFFDNEGTRRTVRGSVILEWELDLPTPFEQSLMVGQELTPYINGNIKSSWIFTKPKNKNLLEVWNYNKGLSKALIKTLTGKDFDIASGYLVPNVTILINSLNAEHITKNDSVKMRDLNKKQIEYMKNSLLKEVGKNLDSDWTKKYIGSVALANYNIGNTIDRPSFQNELNQITDKKASTSEQTFINPAGLLNGAYIQKDSPVWSGLVFNHSSRDKEMENYFHVHTSKATLNSYTVYSIKDGNKYYGYYSEDRGEGLIEDLYLPYMKDSYGKVYKNVELSGYVYNQRTNAINEDISNYNRFKSGKIITYKDQSWLIGSDTDYTINLFSNRFLTGIKKGDEIYEGVSGSLSNTPILSVINEMNIRTFGKGQESGINSSLYMKTESFDFVPPKSIIDVNQKFLAIKNGKLIPHIYTNVVLPNGNISVVLKKTTLDEGEPISIPQFVSLAKNTWSIEGDRLVWKKKFYGADASLYTKGIALQNLKEQLISQESKNIIYTEDLKDGRIAMSGLEGDLTNDVVIFKIPFKSNMTVDSKLNWDIVNDAFMDYSDLVIYNTSTPTATGQYFKDRSVGYYDSDYKGYFNTLVLVGDKLKVANGTKLSDYTPTSIIDSVSLGAILMDGVRLLNNGVSYSSNSYKIYQYQDVKPPAIIAPFTNGAPPLLASDSSVVADTPSKISGMPTSLELFDSLEDYLERIAIENAWFSLIYVMLSICLFLSVTTLLSHVFYDMPLGNTLFNRVKDVTGIDVLAILSIGAVRLEGENNSWVKTIKYSATIGILPVVIFGLMKVYGMIA